MFEIDYLTGSSSNTFEMWQPLTYYKF